MKAKRIKPIALFFFLCGIIGIIGIIGVLVFAASARQRLPVIAYHHIQEDVAGADIDSIPYIVTVAAFEKQMKYLYDNNYHAITPDELTDFLYNGKALPRKSVFIQFDDGYYSNIALAYPILQKYGLKATVFLITAETAITTAPTGRGELSYISKSDMTGASDVFTYSSHTHSLHEFAGDSTLFLMASRAEILDDLRQSFEIIDNHTIMSYPHGQYNDEKIEMIKEAGIKAAFTTKRGYVTKSADPYKLSRFSVFNKTSFAGFVIYVRGVRFYP